MCAWWCQQSTWMPECLFTCNVYFQTLVNFKIKQVSFVPITQFFNSKMCLTNMCFSKTLTDRDKMKYSTSPPVSRCASPMSVRSSSSSLPMPVTYKWVQTKINSVLLLQLHSICCFEYCRQDCFGAPTKCYKYLRKLFKFEQMDFEFAMWQMIYLFTSPQKVYRNFQSRKRECPHKFSAVIIILFSA